VTRSVIDLIALPGKPVDVPTKMSLFADEKFCRGLYTMPIPMARKFCTILVNLLGLEMKPTPLCDLLDTSQINDQIGHNYPIFLSNYTEKLRVILLRYRRNTKKTIQRRGKKNPTQTHTPSTKQKLNKQKKADKPN
jgi:hypothetical protein